jgi:hypothetical protein
VTPDPRGFAAPLRVYVSAPDVECPLDRTVRERTRAARSHRERCGAGTLRVGANVHVKRPGSACLA